MSNTPFMQLYIGDYMADTRHLSTEQHGAYLLLLMTMWTHGARLPSDQKKLARVAGLTPRKWAAAWEDLGAFFEDDGEWITNPRMTKEYKKASEKSQKRADAGSKGGRAKALKEKKSAQAKATHLPQHLPEPEPYKRDTNVSLSSAREPDGFEEFWNSYPHRGGAKRGKKDARKAWGKAVKSVPSQQIIDAAKSFHSDRKVLDGYAPDPATWLNAEGWEDDIEAPRSSRPASPDRETYGQEAMRRIRMEMEGRVDEMENAVTRPSLIAIGGYRQ